MIKLKINTTNVHCSILREHIQMQIQLIGGDVIEVDFGQMTDEKGRLDQITPIEITKIITVEDEFVDERIDDYFFNEGLDEMEIVSEIKKQYLEAKGFNNPEKTTDKFKMSEEFMVNPVASMLSAIFGDQSPIIGMSNIKIDRKNIN